jgi:uncharacterized membrane protein
MIAESILRGAFTQTISRISLVLALITTVILVIHYWQYILVVTLVVLGIVLMLQRLRELTG